MRLFVAVNIAEGVRRRLAAAQARLVATGADVKWTDLAGFHFTLKFLGEVEESRVGQVQEAAAAALWGQGSFRLALGGVGGFPSARAPRVVWVGVREGEQALAALAAALEAALEPLGFAREQRPYSGHLTLGRVRTPRGREALAAAMAALADQDFGGMAVEKVELMQSRLSPRGAAYSPVAAFQLGSR